MNGALRERNHEPDGRALDLNGSLTVGATGSLALGSATHTFGGASSVSGGFTATGTLVFDGTRGDHLRRRPRFRTSRSRRRGRPGVVDGNVTVNGNLTQTSGALLVVRSTAASRWRSRGTRSSRAGRSSSSHVGVIDVAGNVTFSGTTMQGDPTIRCGGNWVVQRGLRAGGRTRRLRRNGRADGHERRHVPRRDDRGDVEHHDEHVVDAQRPADGQRILHGLGGRADGQRRALGDRTMSLTSAPRPERLALRSARPERSRSASATHTFAGSLAVTAGSRRAEPSCSTAPRRRTISSTAALPNVQISKSAGGARFVGRQRDGQRQPDADLGRFFVRSSAASRCRSPGTRSSRAGRSSTARRDHRRRRERDVLGDDHAGHHADHPLRRELDLGRRLRADRRDGRARRRGRDDDRARGRRRNARRSRRS